MLIGTLEMWIHAMMNYFGGDERELKKKCFDCNGKIYSVWLRDKSYTLQKGKEQMQCSLNSQQGADLLVKTRWHNFFFHMLFVPPASLIPDPTDGDLLAIYGGSSCSLSPKLMQDRHFFFSIPNLSLTKRFRISLPEFNTRKMGLKYINI